MEASKISSVHLMSSSKAVLDRSLTESSECKSSSSHPIFCSTQILMPREFATKESMGKEFELAKKSGGIDVWTVSLTTPSMRTPQCSSLSIKCGSMLETKIGDKTNTDLTVEPAEFLRHNDNASASNLDVVTWDLPQSASSTAWCGDGDIVRETSQREGLTVWGLAQTGTAGMFSMDESDITPPSSLNMSSAASQSQTCRCLPRQPGNQTRNTNLEGQTKRGEFLRHAEAATDMEVVTWDLSRSNVSPADCLEKSPSCSTSEKLTTWGLACTRSNGMFCTV